MSDETVGGRRWNLQKLRLVARVLFGGASIIFVVVAGYKLAARWQSGKVTVNWPLLCASAIPIAVGAVILATGWKWLMERMVGHKLPLRPCLTLHFESQMARYTPGKVGIPLVRMAGAEKLGVPAAVAGYSVLTESISMVAVGGVVGFAVLLATNQHASNVMDSFGGLGTLGLAAFVVVTAVLVFVNRTLLPRMFVNLMKAEGGAGPLIPRRGPLAHGLYWLSWAVHGYLASRSVGIASVHALSGAGLYVLAPIAGFLALATPSGIGVREAVISVGLSPLVGPAPAVAAAIVSRAISVLVDCLVWAFGRLVLSGPSPS